MHAISPAKPQPGSSRHAFGRCDVATLQELYDTPDNRTAISTCNDVATTPAALAHALGDRCRGDQVKLTAVLRIEDRSAYRRLAGNPLNGRSLKLKYRRAGSADDWQTAWMRSLYSGGSLRADHHARSRPGSSRPPSRAPDDEGLRYSRSELVKVKVQT